MTHEPILRVPAYTLAEMREHAQEALRRKPVRLDIELLARDMLELCERLEALERPSLLAEEFTVLGRCIHGVDLDREFCPQGCRV